MSMLKLDCALFRKLFIVLAVTFCALPAHAHMARHACDVLLEPQDILTNEMAETISIDIDSVYPHELKNLLGQPLIYKELWYFIGPVVYHRPAEFSQIRQRVIRDVMTAAHQGELLNDAKRRNPEDSFADGIEVGKAIFTLKSGEVFITELKTSYGAFHISLTDIFAGFAHGNKITAENFAKVEIYHSHPGKKLSHTAISFDDMRTSKELVEALAELGAHPQVHIFAINDSSIGRVVSHYSLQR